MTDETKDVEKVDKTTTAPSTETKDTKETKDDGTVPRHRLNEESDKRKAAEAEASTAKANEAAAQAKITALQQALGGSTDAQKDEIISSFASKYNVPDGFVSELLDVASKKLNKQTPDPVVLEAVAEVRFNREWDTLLDEVPEAKDLSREDKAELKKRAWSKEFLNVPLKSIYRDITYDKRPVTKDSFEGSRSGGRQSEAGPVDFGKMSIKEMREWSASNLSNKRRR